MPKSDETMPPNDPPGTGDKPGGHREFMHRLVLMDGIALMFVLVLATLWFAADALLLVFACILFAILLYELTCVVQERFKMQRKFALPLVVLLMLAIIGIGGWLMAPQISDQADKLAEAVPKALSDLRQELSKYDLARRLLGGIPSDDQLRGYLAKLVPNAGLFFSGVLGAVGNVLIITCVGIYFAAQPMLYIDGLVTLVCPAPIASGWDTWPIYIGVFISGSVAIGAQIAWTRILSLLFGATKYHWVMAADSWTWKRKIQLGACVPVSDAHVA